MTIKVVVCRLPCTIWLSMMTARQAVNSLWLPHLLMVPANHHPSPASLLTNALMGQHCLGVHQAHPWPLAETQHSSLGLGSNCHGRGMQGLSKGLKGPKSKGKSVHRFHNAYKNQGLRCLCSTGTIPSYSSKLIICMNNRLSRCPHSAQVISVLSNHQRQLATLARCRHRQVS